MNTVTVQVAAGSTLIQDTKEIAVHGNLSLLQSHLRGASRGAEQTVAAEPK